MMPLGISLKKNFLIILCLIASVAGILLIYFVAVTSQTKNTSIGDLNPDFVGKAVSVQGIIIYRNTHPAGHVFLTVADGNSKIDVPLFSGFVTNLEKSGIDSSYFAKGVRVQVTGLVDQYKGQLQIIPRKVSDIKILSDGVGS